jgi:hypothetical protein
MRARKKKERTRVMRGKCVVNIDHAFCNPRNSFIFQHSKNKISQICTQKFSLLICESRFEKSCYIR